MTLTRLLCTGAFVLMLAGGAAAKPGTATATATVNLRANADTGAAILAKIPAGARIEVGECTEGWCAVTYQGKSGFAIQTALDTSGRVVRRAPVRRPPPYGAPPPGVYDDDFEPAPYVVGPRVYVGPPVVYGPGPYWGPGWGYYRPWGWGPGWRRW
jgi:uncharacterized protein YraI